MWTLRELIRHASSTATEINGKWVPSRPLRIGGIERLRDALAVLMDKADAFVWPEGQ